MNELLHPVRLWWAGGVGLIRCDEVEMRLRHRPPVLQHIEHVQEIEFIPGVCPPYVQPRGEARRDLEAAEVQECMRYVTAWAASCRGLSERGSPRD